MKLRASLPLGLLALTALALAAQGVVLKRTPKVGDKNTYVMKGTFNLKSMGIEGTLTSKTVEEVTKIENDVVTTKSSATMSANVMGTDQELPESTTVAEGKIDGTPVSVKVNDADSPVAMRLANMNFLLMPSTPIEVGKEWVAEAKKDEAKDRPGYKITYKLIGEEKVGKWDTYKISAEGGETEGSAPTKVKATYWIDKTNGNLVRALSELTDAVFQAEFGAMDAKMDLNLQP